MKSIFFHFSKHSIFIVGNSCVHGNSLDAKLGYAYNGKKVLGLNRPMFV